MKSTKKQMSSNIINI